MGTTHGEGSGRLTEALARGELEYERVKARWEAIPAERLQPPPVELRAAALVALSVERFASGPEVKPRFLALASVHEFEADHLEALPSLAWAAWYVKHRLLSASGAPGDAHLPESLVLDALATRTRMRKAVGYHLGDDPKVARMLRFLALGTGYHDLANDLTGYGALYAEHDAALRSDTKNYRATDQAHAFDLAKQIEDALSGTGNSEQDRWNLLQPRAWVALSTAYEELHRAGQFLFYRHPRVDALFPPLVTAARERVDVPGSPLVPSVPPPAETA